MIKQSLLIIIIIMSLFACEEPVDHKQPWKIGGKHGMSNVIFDQGQTADIKICSDKYKDIGFSTNINVDYDDQTYFRLIEGLCVTLHAKKVRIRFATPSSGKRAEGTYEILQSSSK